MAKKDGDINVTALFVDIAIFLVFAGAIVAALIFRR